MIKISTYLAAFALMALAATGARADVISPVNDNAAIKIVLPLPADQYMPFTLKLNGQAVVLGQEIAIDSGNKCLKFETLITDLKMQYSTEFCGNFAMGSTSEIQMPSIRFVGNMTYPDAVFGKAPFYYTFSDKAGKSQVSFQREITDFAYPKLLPYIVESTEVSVKMPRSKAKLLTADPITKVIEFINPAKALPETVFTRVDAKIFPDAIPLVVELRRAPYEYEFGLPTSVSARMPIDQDSITAHWYKMPWTMTDGITLFHNGICYAASCYTPFQTDGSDVYGKAVASTVPTKINVHRIDVDDVVVNSAEGQTKRVKGTYSVQYNATDFLVRNAQTATGIDVLPGQYSVVVNYVDPFTGVSESKNYKLDFK